MATMQIHRPDVLLALRTAKPGVSTWWRGHSRTAATIGWQTPLEHISFPVLNVVAMDGAVSETRTAKREVLV